MAFLSLPKSHRTRMPELDLYPMRDTNYYQDAPDREVLLPNSNAPSFPPFRFEPKRTRIDWRMLHGIEINPIIRDVDLDTLEKVVSVIAYGDIEAEDVRHLTELNFIKVFRLSQLTVEYLLYVQDCLQSTNNWLLQDRSDIEKYLQAARLRVRELDAHLKVNKRELRRARKTAKTYEAMTALNKGGMQVDQQGADAKPPAEAPMSAAMEAMVKRELTYMSERLGRSQVEVQQLRAEREEVLSQLHDIESSLASNQGFSSKASPRVQDQLVKVQAELRVAKREKEDLASQVDKMTLEKKELQSQKTTLLRELDVQQAVGASVDGRPPSPSVSSLLMDAERDKGRLESELATTQAELDAVRKQLMKNMKDQAMGGGGGGVAVEELQKQLIAAEGANKELANRSSDLERDLSDKKRTIRDLEDELELTRHQAAESQQKLLAAKQLDKLLSKSGSVGGFIKMDANEELKELQRVKDKLQEKVKALQSELTEVRLAKQLADQSLVDCELKLAQMKSSWNDLKAQLPSEHEAKPGSLMAKGGVVRQKVEEFEKLASREIAPPPALMLKSPSFLNPTRQSALEESFKFSAQPSAPSIASPPTPMMPSSSHAQAAVQPVSQAPNLSRHRASDSEMRRVKAELMTRLRGLGKDEIQLMLDDEFRVISENPFEYEGDDEGRFHALMPYLVPGREGVRSTQRHSTLDLGAADRLLGQVLCKVDDEISTYGLDPDQRSMEDAEYAASMIELDVRRQARISSLPLPMIINEDSEEIHPVNFLRDALMTHLELVRRDAVVSRGKQTVLEEGEMTDGERTKLASSAARTVQPSTLNQAVPVASAAPVFSLPPKQVSAIDGELPKASSASFSRMPPSANQAFVSQARPSFKVSDTDFDHDDDDEIEEERLEERQASVEEHEDSYNATFGARVPAARPALIPPGHSNSSLNSSLTTPRINPLDQSLKKQAEGFGRTSLNQSTSKGASGNASLNQSLGRHPNIGGIAAGAAALRPAAVQQLLDDEKHVASGGTLNSSIRSKASPSRRNYSDFDNDDDSEEEVRMPPASDSLPQGQGFRAPGVQSTPAGGGGEMMSFDDDDEDAVDEGDLSGGWRTGDQMLMPQIVQAAALANAQIAAEEEMDRRKSDSPETKPSLDVMEDSVGSWDGINDSLPASGQWAGAAGGAGGSGGGMKGVMDLPPPRKWSKAGGDGSDDEGGGGVKGNKNKTASKAEVWRAEDDDFDLKEESLEEARAAIPTKLPSFNSARAIKQEERPVLFLDHSLS